MDLCRIETRLSVHVSIYYLAISCSIYYIGEYFENKFSDIQDLKPRFHSSRFHGSEDAEDDVCFILNFMPYYLCLLVWLVSLNQNVFCADLYFY